MSIKHKEEEYKEKEDFYKYLLYLIRPEIYEKIMPKDYTYETKVPDDAFDSMNVDEFKKLTSKTKQYRDLHTVAAGEEASNINLENLNTLINNEGHIPQLGKTTPEEDYNMNPITFRRT